MPTKPQARTQMAEEPAGQSTNTKALFCGRRNFLIPYWISDQTFDIIKFRIFYNILRLYIHSQEEYLSG